MYKNKHVSVVVPAYNEEAFVAEVIETVPAFVDRIYPVDDSSTDETWEEITRAADSVNSRLEDSDNATPTQLSDGGERWRVVPLRHSDNQGVGATIKTGYRRALADGTDVIAVMNGDGQMDPEMLDRLLDPVVEGRAGYAKGNRLESSEHWTGMTRWRLFGNFLLTQLTRMASGYWGMKDPQNGYTAVSVDALEAVDLDSVYDQYGFLNDLLIRLNANDVRIADVEMQAVYGEESSSIRYTQFVPSLSWLLLRQFIWRLRMKLAGGQQLTALPYFAGMAVGVVSIVVVVARLMTVDALSVELLFGIALSFLLLVIGVAQEWRRDSVLRLTHGD